MSGVRLEAVTRRFGDVWPLTGLDLEAEHGQLLVVLGPSGSGKTTLLRIVAGLDRPTSGRVLIGGDDVTDVPAAKRDVAMVFQSYALFPHLTVAENVGFGLRARRVPRAETARRVQAAATAVGCEELLSRRPHELSGGERQRVALARALVREPKVFLFDEPLSNLDAELRLRVRAELRSLHDRVGGTTLHVTHDQLEALALADRIAVMSGGRVHQVGTPSNVWDRPVSVTVARAVGSPPMNLLAAEGTVRLWADPRGAATVGIRPEHLVLDPHGSGATVQLVELVGADALVHLRADGETLLVRTTAATRPLRGSSVGLHADVAHLHFFDKTGARIERT